MQAMNEAGVSWSFEREAGHGTWPPPAEVTGAKTPSGEIAGPSEQKPSSPAPRLISPSFRERYLELSRNKTKATCSCCGAEAAAEGGGKKFKVCSTCRRKAYCSAACQHQDWKEGGHKRSCRPQKDFRADDVVVAEGIQSKPELNGQLMVVVGSASEGRWQVIVDASGKSISLHADKLRLVVPVEEREDIAG